jgi:peptidoglycan-associated lipoprotein
MKLAKSAQFLAIALACSTALVGCRKGLDKTTHIPGQDKSKIVDSNPSGLRDTGPGTGGVVPPFNPNANNLGNNGVNGVPAVFDPTKGEGIAAAGGDFTNWKENREEFAAQTVYFEFDKSNIKPGEIKKLEEVVQKMKASFQGKALRIEGHCDERGTEEYNRALGDRRALSVRESLVQLGLPADMLPTITFGEEKPADSGHDDAAWKKNRRAELILLTPP